MDKLNQLRADFESWIQEGETFESKPKRHRSGKYIEPDVQLAWEAVQEFAARAAVPAQAGAADQVMRAALDKAQGALLASRPKLDGLAGGWERHTQAINAVAAALHPPAAAQPPAQAGAADGKPLVGRDGRMAHWLRDHIEGMSVSMDVSTGDHDADHRYFGVVSEVMDDEGDKHGVTLLVYNAQPNFDRPAAQRLRNVAALVGVPCDGDDAHVDGVRGALLGQIAYELRKRATAQGDGEHSGRVRYKRGAFEEWFKASRGVPELIRRGDGYQSGEAQHAWADWVRAISIAAQQERGPT